MTEKGVSSDWNEYVKSTFRVVVSVLLNLKVDLNFGAQYA